jgi:hypothetical protein
VIEWNGGIVEWWTYGGYSLVSTNLSLLLLEGGAVRGTVSVNCDITNLKLRKLLVL